MIYLYIFPIICYNIFIFKQLYPKTSCQSACLVSVDVPGFVSLVGEKRYAEALKLHRERNPFVAVCARVCFHTCEGKCRQSGKSP
jgi:NADH-quinone oxidoreductase subunit F